MHAGMRYIPREAWSSPKREREVVGAPFHGVVMVARVPVLLTEAPS